MSKFKHFLGIDVSKEYFDAVVILEGNKSKHLLMIQKELNCSASGLKSKMQLLKTH